MAKKKFAGKRASRRNSKKKTPVKRVAHAVRSPAVLFELGCKANSFLYWMVCRFILSTPLTRACEQNAADDLRIAWHDAWPSSVHPTSIDSIIRETRNQLQQLETEQWNTEIRPQLFQGIHGPIFHPEEESPFIDRYRNECHSMIQQAQFKLFYWIESNLRSREMLVVKLGQAADQIHNPVDLELIWPRVSWAYAQQGPIANRNLEPSWPSEETSRNRGILFQSRSPVQDDDVRELKAALLAQPRWEESVRLRGDWNDFDRDRVGLNIRCFPPEDSQLDHHRFRRGIIIEICQLLKHAAAEWHSRTAEGLTPSEIAVRQTTAGRLHNFLADWSASLGGPMQGLRALVERLISQDPDYRYLGVWVDVESKMAGRRNFSALKLRSRKAAILLNALTNQPVGAPVNPPVNATINESDGFTSYAFLLSLLSLGVENMEAVYKAKSDLAPSLRHLGLEVRRHTFLEKGYILRPAGR